MAAIVECYLPFQVLHPPGHRVAVGLRVDSNIAEFACYLLGSGINRVSHSQINHVVAVPAFFHLDFVDHPEQIWRKLVHTICKTNFKSLGHVILLLNYRQVMKRKRQ